MRCMQCSLRFASLLPVPLCRTQGGPLQPRLAHQKVRHPKVPARCARNCTCSPLSVLAAAPVVPAASPYLHSQLHPGRGRWDALLWPAQPSRDRRLLLPSQSTAAPRPWVPVVISCSVHACRCRWCCPAQPSRPPCPLVRRHVLCPACGSGEGWSVACHWTVCSPGLPHVGKLTLLLFSVAAAAAAATAAFLDRCFCLPSTPNPPHALPPSLQLLRGLAAGFRSFWPCSCLPLRVASCIAAAARPGHRHEGLQLQLRQPVEAFRQGGQRFGRCMVRLREALRAVHGAAVWPAAEPTRHSG